MANLTERAESNRTESDDEQESLVWTTQDEQEFIRYMYNRKNLRGLVEYSKVLPYRSFYGPGMYVDVHLVRMSLETHIDALMGDGVA